MIGIEGLTFHHIGVASRSFARDRSAFEAMGYVDEGEIFEDPIQKIKGLFMIGGGPRVELVTPSSESEGVLTGVLNRGEKMYHMAYEAVDFSAALLALRAQRGKIIVEPVPAVAFGGRNIAFAFLPNLLLIELIEL